MVTGRCQATTVAAEGHDPSMGVFMVRRPARLAALAAVALLAPMVATLGASPGAADTGTTTPRSSPSPRARWPTSSARSRRPTDFDKLRDAYFETRLLSGDRPLTIEKAAKLRGKGITAVEPAPDRGREQRRAASEVRGPASARTRPCRWSGPATPTRRCPAGSAPWRCATTARSSWAPPRAASGPTTRRPGTWTSRTQDTDTQAVGALAVAPSNDNDRLPGLRRGRAVR